MAFDAGPRSEPLPAPQPFQKLPVTWMDRLDAVLRAVVLLPLLGLYTWWVFDIFRTGITALIQR